MLAVRKLVVWTAVIVVVAFATGPVSAGTYFNGTAYNGWEGSTDFDNGVGLSGHVNWIVYGVGGFPSEYTGYTPTPGELTYVYQVVSSGEADISSYTVLLLNGYGDHPGAFGDGVVSPIGQYSIADGQAYWPFSINGISQGSNSQLLAFSAPTVPENTTSWVINNGDFAGSEPVPGPSATPIPEPATFTLALVGAGLLGGMATAGRWRRRR
jgi:hypothetical protein